MPKPFRRLALAYARRTYKQLPEPLAKWAEHGGVFWAWSTEEMIAQHTWTALPRNLFHLATLKAASVIDCPWCLDFGSHLSANDGVTEQELRDLHRWRDSDAYDADERLALEFAEQVTATPCVVDDELVEAVRERFGEQGLVELTAVVALENQRSRFNKTMGVLPQGWSRVCAVPTPPAEVAQLARYATR